MTSPPPTPDLIFGKYEVQSRLAVGGMGEVFFAVQRGVQGFERPAILKNLLPDLAQQEGFVDQFLDEARVAATLNHPNVVSIYEVGLWNGTYFIAMEYIHGRNIAQLMRAAGRAKVTVSPLVAATILRDAALGLQHAHQATDAYGRPLNIVHRDISPQNIMVREDGVTKVVDFGIARAANRATRTQTGAVKGKLAYMPPEQVLQGSAVTAKADQYALGVVLWEMLAQRRLFRAESDIELMRLVVEARVPPLTEVAPGLPEPLVEVAHRMLAKEPERRFADCAEAARALDLCISQLSPPGGESPVSAFIRSLGPWDVPTPVSTPSNAKNFVISLGGAQPAPAPQPPPEGVSVVLTAQLEDAPPKRTRLFVGLGVAAVATIGVAVLALRPSVGTVQVEATPACVISVDGQPGASEAVTTRTLELKAGEHRVSCALPTEPAPGALREKTQVVQVIAGQQATVRFDLTPPPAPIVPPPPTEPPPAISKLARWTIQSTPPGAAVRLDGRPMGEAPLELKVTAGETHCLQLERAGFQRVERELPVLSPGEARTEEVVLVALKASGPRPPVVTKPLEPTAQAASGPGFLSVSTTPWTKVSVGRDLLGSTPLFKVKLPPGDHVLSFVNEGQNINTTRKVTVRSGEVTKLDLTLP